MKTNNNYSVTILTCHDKGARANKKFTKHANGEIEKLGYKAGKYFTWQENKVSNLAELAPIIENSANDPRNFIIRGKIKPNIKKEVVCRKARGDDAIFDGVPRPYVMLDMDKIKCPAFFDVANNPEQAVRWTLDMLPEPFRNVDCFYQFSASQNVAMNETSNKNTISVHLWFFLDREVSDDEWKRYFKSVASPVDVSLFTAVQPHFIAKPVFVNMNDPLPNRSGLLKGKSDFLTVPDIPEPEKRQASKRVTVEPVVTEDEKQKAIEILSQYYSDGSRNRFTATIASVLYRGGWHCDNVADFILELAEYNKDQESYDRFKNALRICDTVDNGFPAPGIPTLQKEFKIKTLDELLDLLGVGEPKIETLISKMNPKSNFDEIKSVLSVLIKLPKTKRDFYIGKIAKDTKNTKQILTSLIEEIGKQDSVFTPQDMADELMESLLNAEYKQGHHLVYTADKIYWCYNGRYWSKIPDHQIKSVLLEHAREFIFFEEKGSVAYFNNAVLNILEGRVFIESDPLRSIDGNVAPVINCFNGEVWFDDHGAVELCPHRAHSYIRNCLNVEYDPEAQCPKFEKAVLEIFSNSLDPKDMFRHVTEIMGYIAQPSRKTAAIFLFYGGGSNGKTSLVQLLMRMMGENTVMSDRIGDIETNVFKIGDLDGKLLLLDDDVDGGTCLPDGFLKKISEEKILTGQHKHKPPFRFTCRAAPLMLANDFPVTRDLTYGIRRRLQVVPFNRRFENHEADPNLFDRIWEQESSGILNQMIAGFQRLKQRGYFSEPKDCLKVKNEWITRANVLTTFIDEDCQRGKDYKIPLKDFYGEFCAYCENTRVKNIPSRKLVKSRLQDLGYKIGILNGEDAVWGLGIPNDFERPIKNVVNL